MNERRRFSRQQLNFDVQVEFQEQAYLGKIINLSLKGVLLEISNFPAQKNNLCEISINLSEDVIMKFESRLIHSDDNYFGFKFESSDLDSITHLRRCLEYNGNEPNKIEEELFFLATGYSE